MNNKVNTESLEDLKAQVGSLQGDSLFNYLTEKRKFYRQQLEKLKSEDNDLPVIVEILAFIKPLHRELILPKANALAADYGFRAEFLGDIETVGVQGDFRTYTDVIVLVGPVVEHRIFEEVSGLISNSLPINKVTYEVAEAQSA